MSTTTFSNGTVVLPAWLQDVNDFTYLGKDIAGILALNVKAYPYGAKGDGSTDDTAAFTAALATGKDIFIPPGTYKITSTLSLAAANQRIFGAGWSSQLTFNFLSANPGIAATNSGGWQRIENLFLNGVANVSKVISIGSPDITICNNYILNSSTIGSGIYQENENSGSNVFVFDARIESNLIYGTLTAGNYGIRLGTNHQATKVLKNSVQNWGSHLYINGATTITTVMYNIFQRSVTTGATAAAIVINNPGSGMPVYDVNITDNYFEQNLVMVYLDDCNPNNLTIRKNFFTRNTTTIAGSAIYKTGTGTNAAAGNIQIDDNYCDGCEYVFSLNNQYGATITSAKNNTVTFSGAAAYNGGTAYVIGNVVSFNNSFYYCIANTTGNAPTNVSFWAPTGYATGSFASKAYDIRAHNAYFGAVLTSGTFTSQNVNRQEVGNTTFRMFFRWDTHEYLDTIQIRYLPTATATVTVNLRQVVMDTDTIIATSGSVSTSSTISIPINQYAPGGANGHYYLEFVCTLSSGTAYVYPAEALLRL